MTTSMWLTSPGTAIRRLDAPSSKLYPLNAPPTWIRIGAYINHTSYVTDGLRLMMFKDGAALAGGNALPVLAHTH